MASKATVGLHEPSEDMLRPLGSDRWNQQYSPRAKERVAVPSSAEENAPNHLRNFLQTPSSLAQSSPGALHESMQSDTSIAVDDSLIAAMPQHGLREAAPSAGQARQTAIGQTGGDDPRNPSKDGDLQDAGFLDQSLATDLSPTSSPSERDPPMDIDATPIVRGDWRPRPHQRGVDLPSTNRRFVDAGLERTPRPCSPPTPPSAPTPHAAIRKMEQEIERLKKQNFNLKLRIYFLEEALAAAGIDYRTIDGAQPAGNGGTNEDSSLSHHGAADFDSIRVELEAKEKRLQNMREELEERLADLEERDELLQTAREAIVGLQDALAEAQARLARAEQQAREAAEMGLPAENTGQTRESGTESLKQETVQEAIQQALTTAEEAFRLKMQAMENELRSRDEHIQHLEDELNRIRDSKDVEIRALQEELDAALRDRENEIESAQAVLEKERRSGTERLRALEIQLAEANRRVEQLDSEAKRFQKLLAESEERRISLKQALEQATASPLETTAHEEIRAQLATLQQERSVLESELDAARAEQARLVACLSASEATCRNVEQRCRDLEAAAVESTSDASLRMRRLVDAHEQERKHWQLTEQRLRRSEEEQREQLDETKKALEKIKEELADERRNHARLELEQAQTQSRADSFQMHLEAKQSEIDALRLRVASAERERQQWRDELDICQRERDELAEKLHAAITHVAALEQAQQLKSVTQASSPLADATDAPTESPRRTHGVSSGGELRTGAAQIASNAPEMTIDNGSLGLEPNVRSRQEEHQKRIEWLEAEQARYQRLCHSLEDAVADRDRHIHQLTTQLNQLAARERQLTEQLQAASVCMSKAGGQVSGGDPQPLSPAKNGNERSTGATSAPVPPATIDWEALRLEIQTLRDDILFWREEARMFREEALSLRRLHKGRLETAARDAPAVPTGKPEIIPRPAEDKLPGQADERSWEKELRTLEHRLERMMTTVNRLVQARMQNPDTHSESGVEAETQVPEEHPSLPQAPQTKSTAGKPVQHERNLQGKPLSGHETKQHNALNWLTGSPTADELGADTGDDPDDTQVSREVVRLLRTRHHHRRRVEAPAPAKQPTEAVDSNQRPPPAEEYRLPFRQTWQNAILRQVEETQRIIAATQKRLERERAAFLRRTHAQPVPRLSDDDLTA